MAIVTFTAGCQSVSSLGVPPTDDLINLIDYGNSVRSLDGPGLEAQYERLVLAQTSDPSAADTIRLALLLSYPSAPFYDVSRARHLLRSVSETDGGMQATVDFAELLDKLLAERTSLTGRASDLGELLLDERNHARLLAADLAEARAALEAERQLRVTLQGQLDALKELEKRLNAEDIAP